MINNGYSLSVNDFTEFHKFRNNSAYGTYLKNISSSPVFKTIMNEHINNVDISEDIKKLKIAGKLPDSVSEKALSDLFKQSIARMAICIAADTVILKELEDTKIEDVISSISEDSNINYLLGKAEEKYYEQATILLDQGKLDENTLAFKGLVAHLKQKGNLKPEINNLDKLSIPKTTKKEIVKKSPDLKANFNSSEIEL